MPKKEDKKLPSFATRFRRTFGLYSTIDFFPKPTRVKGEAPSPKEESVPSKQGS